MAEKKNVISQILSAAYTIIMFLCKMMLVMDVVITAVAVAGRYISFIPDPKWSEEVVLTLMIYMALIGSALAVRNQSHIRITAFDRYLPARVLKWIDVFDDLVVLVFSLIMVFSGWKYATTLGAKGFYVSLPKLSKFWLYACVPIAGLSVAVFQLEILVKHIKVALNKEVGV